MNGDTSDSRQTRRSMLDDLPENDSLRPLVAKIEAKFSETIDYYHGRSKSHCRWAKRTVYGVSGLVIFGSALGVIAMTPLGDVIETWLYGVGQPDPVFRLAEIGLLILALAALVGNWASRRGLTKAWVRYCKTRQLLVGIETRFQTYLLGQFATDTHSKQETVKELQKFVEEFVSLVNDETKEWADAVRKDFRSLLISQESESH